MAAESKTPHSTLDRPTSPGQMFWVFTRMALQGFGGVLPVAQRELVERVRWLDRAQFLELLALSQVLPGPNVVNLSLMVGDRFFGARGAFAACSGMLALPFVIVIALAAAVGQTQHLPAVAGALRGMALVAGGLVLATAIKLALPQLRGPKASALGLPMLLALIAATVLAVALWRWPLVATLAGLGGFGTAWAAWRLSSLRSDA
jgi:chromate transporter